jgi:hypothetical protein
MDFIDLFSYIYSAKQKRGGTIMENGRLFFVFPACIAVFLLLVWAPGILSQNLSVEITSPSNSERYAECSDILITANAQTQGGEIKGVQFFQNDISLINDTRAPYEYSWKNVPPGFYRLTAKAVDKLNNEAWSKTVVMIVGNVMDGDVLINGEFSCRKEPWGFNIYVAEGRATFDLDPNAWIADSTAALFTIENGGSELWHIQLQQPLPIQSGHSYSVSFSADASPMKTIEFVFQDNTSAHVVYFSQQVVIDHVGEYGPFTFDCKNDDPGAYIRFNIGKTTGTLYLDQIRVIDPSVTAVEGRASSGDRTIPSDCQLQQNYPNPFNARTIIEYQLTEDATVKLEISDLRERKIRTLVQSIQKRGEHRVIWDGMDSSSSTAPSGVYFYRLIVRSSGGVHAISKKLLLIK